MAGKASGGSISARTMTRGAGEEGTDGEENNNWVWFFKLFGVPLQIGVGLTHLVVRQVAQGGTFCGGCA